MTPPTTTMDSVRTLLNNTGFAVLATESSGQPHTSLIAITPLGEGQRLVFATYRNTRKFTNVMQNPCVSLLIDDRYSKAASRTPDGLIVSAVGRVRDIDPGTISQLAAAHLQNHPELVTFLQTPDCVLLEVVVDRYQVVRGIDDVTWWCVEELKEPAQ